MRTSKNWRAAATAAMILAASGLAQTLDEPADKTKAEPVAEPVTEPTKTPATTPTIPTATPVEATPTATPASEGSQDSDAKAKLDAFIDKMKTLKSLKFKVEFAIEGQGKEIMGPQEATFTALRTDKGWSHRVTGRGKRTPKVEWLEFDIAYASGNASWLDAEAKKLMNKPVAVARGKMFEAMSNLRSVNDLFLATPLTKERSSPELAMRPPEKVGDVECDVVVAPGGSGGDAVFYLAKSDHLPRKIVRERRAARGDTMMVLTFTEVKADEKVEPAAVEIALPDGYTKEHTPTTPTAAKPTGLKPTVPPQPTHNPEAGAETEIKHGEDGQVVPTRPGHPAVATPVPAKHDEGFDEETGGPITATPSPTTPVQPPASTPPPPTNTPNTPTPPAPAPTASDITSLPAFDLKTDGNKSVTAESLRGKPAIIIFYGTWSISSRKTLPEFKAFEDRYKDKATIHFAAVRQRDGQAAVKAARDAGLVSPVLANADTLADQLHVGAFPSVFVFSADGEILKRPTSVRIEEMLTQAKTAIDAALGMTSADTAKADQTQQDTPNEPK